MPFTPFHLGPGALFKAIGGSRFSFLIFGGSQVLMDIEPLARIIRGDAELHGPSHTILGALTVGVAAAAAGRPASIVALRWLRADPGSLTWSVAFVSAFVGTYSHIVFDAIMHRDMNPLWPLAPGNGLLGLIAVDWLHVFCLACGVVGAAGMAVRARLARS